MQCQCLLPAAATVLVGVAMAVASSGTRTLLNTDLAADYQLVPAGGGMDRLEGIFQWIFSIEKK